MRFRNVLQVSCSMLNISWTWRQAGCKTAVPHTADSVASQLTSIVWVTMADEVLAADCCTSKSPFQPEGTWQYALVVVGNLLMAHYAYWTALLVRGCRITKRKLAAFFLKTNQKTICQHQKETSHTKPVWKKHSRRQDQNRKSQAKLLVPLSHMSHRHNGVGDGCSYVGTLLANISSHQIQQYQISCWNETLAQLRPPMIMGIALCTVSCCAPTKPTLNPTPPSISSKSASKLTLSKHQSGIRSWKWREWLLVQEFEFWTPSGKTSRHCTVLDVTSLSASKWRKIHVVDEVRQLMCWWTMTVPAQWQELPPSNLAPEMACRCLNPSPANMPAIGFAVREKSCPAPGPSRNF